jgi:hypothetical protein
MDCEKKASEVCAKICPVTFIVFYAYTTYCMLELSSDYTEHYFLGSDAVQSGRSSPTFRRNVMSPFHASNYSLWSFLRLYVPSFSQAGSSACFLQPASLTLRPWKWRQNVPPKRQWTSTARRHIPKMILFNVQFMHARHNLLFRWLLNFVCFSKTGNSTETNPHNGQYTSSHSTKLLFEDSLDMSMQLNAWEVNAWPNVVSYHAVLSTTQRWESENKDISRPTNWELQDAHLSNKCGINLLVSCRKHVVKLVARS